MDLFGEINIVSLGDIKKELEDINKKLNELIEVQKMALFFELERNGHGLDWKSLQSLLQESVSK